MKFVEKFPVTKLVEWDRNPRIHSPEEIRALVRSIEDHGWGNPILAQKGTNRVIAGHGRLKAARQKELATVPVVLLDIEDEKADSLSIADNQVASLAAWDDEKLKGLLVEFRDREIDLEALGFTPEFQIASLGPSEPVEGLTDPDEIPEPPEKPVTKPGDLWKLGDHRLLCGDCTKAEDVARVLGGAEPILIVTDPPYGVELDLSWRDRAGRNKFGPSEPNARWYMRGRGHRNVGVTGDSRADWSEAYALVPSVKVLYAWHASRFAREVQNGLERIGFEVLQQLVWNKGQFAFSRQMYHWAHEPCWVARKRKAKVPWYGKRNQSTVWTVASPKMVTAGSKEEKEDHPAQKPVLLYETPIANHLKSGEACFEPFAGSGTAIVAAECLGRRCIAIEIEPVYVDVAVKRWERFTGRKAQLLKEGTRDGSRGKAGPVSPRRGIRGARQPARS